MVVRIWVFVIGFCPNTVLSLPLGLLLRCPQHRPLGCGLLDLIYPSWKPWRVNSAVTSLYLKKPETQTLSDILPLYISKKIITHCIRFLPWRWRHTKLPGLLCGMVSKHLCKGYWETSRLIVISFYFVLFPHLSNGFLRTENWAHSGLELFILAYSPFWDHFPSLCLLQAVAFSE